MYVPVPRPNAELHCCTGTQPPKLQYALMTYMNLHFCFACMDMPPSKASTATCAGTQPPKLRHMYVLV